MEEPAGPWIVAAESEWVQVGGGKLAVRWHAPSGSASSRRDFLAVYEAGQQAMRKYIDYKAIEKEGLTEGRVEFPVPKNPGDYVVRYLKADYTELALSPRISVRSALTVLLGEVKAHTASGDTESLVELLETVMLKIKGSDDLLHREALESWRQQQSRRLKPVPAADDGAASSAAGSEATSAASQEMPQQQQDPHPPTESSLVHSPQSVPARRGRGVSTVRVRGTGHYLKGRDAEGDSRGVWIDGSAIVGGENSAVKGSAKKAAGLWLLVLRLSDLEPLFSSLYDTHHDNTAADRFATDMAAHALESPNEEPERVMVIVTSQYAWEGVFSSAVLCERLARCGANLDRLLNVQRNCANWMSGTYSQPYVLVGIPGRRGGLRFAVEACNPNVKTHSAEVEIALLSRGEEADHIPVGVRFGVDGDWMWALADPPPSAPASTSEVPLPPKAAHDATRGGKGLVPPGAVLHAATPQDSGGDVLRSTLCALVATKGMASLGCIPFAAGQLLPLAEACVQGIDEPGTGADTAAALAQVLAEIGDNGERPDRRKKILEEALPSLIKIYVADREGRVSEGARLDAARAICNLVNDPALSLKNEIVSLSELQCAGREVQRCVAVQMGILAREASSALQIMEGPGLGVLLRILNQNGVAAGTQSFGILEPQMPGTGDGGSRASVEAKTGSGNEDLLTDALFGIRQLSENPTFRVELIRRGALESIIPALAPSRSDAGTVCWAQRHAIRISNNLCSSDVCLCLVSAYAEMGLQPHDKGNECTRSDHQGVVVSGIVTTGWWEGVVEGDLAAMSPSALEKLVAQGMSPAWPPGSVVLMTGIVLQKDPFVSMLRTCQAAGASAVLFHATPSPLPLLANLTRDAADIRLPSIALPAKEAASLEAMASLHPGARCSLQGISSSREVLESRALPLLRVLLPCFSNEVSDQQDKASTEGPGESKGGSLSGTKGGKAEVIRLIRELGGGGRELLDRRGVRLLCLDGGGIRGLVLVEQLRKIEQLTGRRIVDLFDVICGTSTGGLLAMALLLGKELDEIQRCYLKISNSVFKKGWFSAAQQITYSGAKYDARILEDLLRDEYGDKIVQGRVGSYSEHIERECFKRYEIVYRKTDFCAWQSYLLDTPQSPRAFVVSSLASVVPALPYLWRNYSHSISSQSRYPGTCDATVIKALRATSAAPSYFDDVTHDGGRHMDGALVANNPTAIAIHEAQQLYPRARLHCVLSLATGTSPVKSPPGAGVGWQGCLKTLIDGASGVTRISDCLKDILPPDCYFRFSPEGSSFGVAIDQTDKAKIDELQAAALSYVHQQKGRFAELAKVLALED